MIIITLAEYFAGKPHEKSHEQAAQILLDRVMGLLNYLVQTKGLKLSKCPNTGTYISGSKGGSGDGGFRLPTATTGTKLSSHKEATGLDAYDPENCIDDAITEDPSLLIMFDLYREDPKETKHWCHLTIRVPGSKKRTFLI